MFSGRMFQLSTASHVNHCWPQEQFDFRFTDVIRIANFIRMNVLKKITGNKN